MFEKFDILKTPLKIFDLIGSSWMLITAGDISDHNTMTASWGGFGFLWHNPCATIYIRPQRHTKKYLDREKYFTISFYEEKYKDALTFCGTHSGANVNKDKEIDFKPKIFGESVAYEEASLIFVCEKQFLSLMQEKDILKENIVNTFYKDKDFHYIYIGKIVDSYINKSSSLF